MRIRQGKEDEHADQAEPVGRDYVAEVQRHTNKLAEAVESETETTFSRERQRLGVKMAQLRAETVQARGMAKRTDTRSPGTAIQRRKKL
jgi:hypothetical protein